MSTVVKLNHSFIELVWSLNPQKTGHEIKNMFMDVEMVVRISSARPMKATEALGCARIKDKDLK